ncbi:MAG: PTS lactose/cellobiose transporter subunit IIA [Erysipelotrichaceae bacterium]
MKKDEVMQMAFEIISSAGDAMNEYYSALVYYKKNNLNEARIKARKGDEFLKITHTIHTKLIQREANNDEIPYSLLMTHAQDHLNSAINWQRIVNLFLTDE